MPSTTDLNPVDPYNPFPDDDRRLGEIHARLHQRYGQYAADVELALHIAREASAYDYDELAAAFYNRTRRAPSRDVLEMAETLLGENVELAWDITR